jgi:hypothetical protein
MLPDTFSFHLIDVHFLSVRLRTFVRGILDYIIILMSFDTHYNSIYYYKI